MQLSPAQIESINQFIPTFSRYLDDAERDENTLAQQARRDLYEQLLTPLALRQMTELELGQVIGSLWASRIWGDKGYLVERLIQENTLPGLVSSFWQLLWGNESVQARFDGFRKTVKGLGAASVTELLAFTHPDSCGLWNTIVRQGLDLLGFRADLPFIRKSQITGREYALLNDAFSAIQEALATKGVPVQDFLGVNYFLFAVWETARHRLPAPAPTGTVALPATTSAEDFDHDELVDHLVNIGQWLGFHAEKEKLIARGSRVDAIWQARIANLGVVTYVFEVQRRGSIDSLILNLQRAQNNPTVQRLIIVAAGPNIDRIRQEIASLKEDFRKSIGYMEVREVLRAAELIEELSNIIGKLDLVRSEFGV